MIIMIFHPFKSCRNPNGVFSSPLPPPRPSLPSPICVFFLIFSSLFFALLVLFLVNISSIHIETFSYVLTQLAILFLYMVPICVVVFVKTISLSPNTHTFSNQRKNSIEDRAQVKFPPPSIQNLICVNTY